MNAEERAAMKTACNEFSDTCPKMGDKLGFTSKIKNIIKTTD